MSIGTGTAVGTGTYSTSYQYTVGTVTYLSPVVNKGTDTSNEYRGTVPLLTNQAVMSTDTATYHLPVMSIGTLT